MWCASPLWLLAVYKAWAPFIMNRYIDQYVRKEKRGAEVDDVSVRLSVIADQPVVPRSKKKKKKKRTKLYCITYLALAIGRGPLRHKTDTDILRGDSNSLERWSMKRATSRHPSLLNIPAENPEF